MDPTKQKESIYSAERAKIATLDGPPERHEEEGSAETARTTESSEKQGQRTKMAFPELPKTIANLAKFLRETRRMWLTLAASIFGIIVLITVAERVAEWATKTRERRQEHAVASITPESLLARCGQPAGDMTKEVYPLLMRTITYQTGQNGGFAFEFSRTAEEKSDWVFLSMKDVTSGTTYDTPKAKLAAMSCLDSQK